MSLRAIAIARSRRLLIGLIASCVIASSWMAPSVLSAQPLELAAPPAHVSRLVMREILNIEPFDVDAETHSQIYYFPQTAGESGVEASRRNYAMIVVDGILHGKQAQLNLGVYRDGAASLNGERVLEHPGYNMLLDRSATFRAEYYIDGDSEAVQLANVGPSDVEILQVARVEGVRAAAPDYASADSADLPVEDERPEIFAFVPVGTLPAYEPDSREFYRGDIELTRDMFSRKVNLPTDRPVVGVLAAAAPLAPPAKLILGLNNDRSSLLKPRDVSPDRSAVWTWEPHAEWIRLRADRDTSIKRLIAYFGDTLGGADRPSYAEFPHPDHLPALNAGDVQFYTGTGRVEAGAISRVYPLAAGRTPRRIDAVVRAAEAAPGRVHLVFGGEAWETHPGAAVRAFAALSTTKIPAGASSFQLRAADAPMLIDVVSVVYEPLPGATDDLSKADTKALAETLTGHPIPDELLAELSTTLR